MVRREQFFYPSFGDRAMVEAMLWMPDEGQEIRGIVQVAHGILENIKRYEKFAQIFCGHGFVVCGNNYLGHGESLIEGIPGYFGEDKPLEALLEDIEALRRIVKARFPGRGYFLFGHSMGSFLTRILVTRTDDIPDGVILSGTTGPNRLMKWVWKPLTNILWKQKGGKQYSGLVDLLFKSSSRGPFSKKGAPNSKDSDSPAEALGHNRGPTIRLTLSAYYTIFNLLDQISSVRWARSVPQAVPIFMVSGGKDPVGENGKGVYKVYHWLRRAGIEDLAIKLYPQARHDLLNDQNREAVAKDILEWIAPRNK